MCSDLRQKLPKAVTALAKAHDPRHGVAYIHCTAGTLSTLLQLYMPAPDHPQAGYSQGQLPLCTRRSPLFQPTMPAAYLAKAGLQVLCPCVAVLSVPVVLGRAGLGRAPATALAYMYWLRGWKLPEAYETLTTKRRCSPRVEAIRAATADLLTDSRPCQLTVGIRRRGTASTFQVGCHSRTTQPATMQHSNSMHCPGSSVAVRQIQGLPPPVVPTRLLLPVASFFGQEHAVCKGDS